MKSEILQFDRPKKLEATSRPEDRDLGRDGVRLLVTTPDGNVHAQFTELADYLQPGDLLVVNESATIRASLPAQGQVGDFLVNLSTDYGDGLWLVEPRWSTSEPGPLPLAPGDQIQLAALAAHGSPIRYGYVDRDFPLEDYQTIFARVPGSAEMPSAARPFTPRVVDGLLAKGVEIVPIILHTGVSSLEVDADELEDQAMYPEPFQVPPATAQAVNAAMKEGRRVVAVGTTVVRALESAWDGEEVQPASGFTRLYIHPARGVNVVSGLITGFHDSMASHLAMLYALAGEEMIRSAYAEAVDSRYLWHEFGDINLILPRR